jgi:starch-binding outer membrane protein, SusD/RagB family
MKLKIIKSLCNASLGIALFALPSCQKFLDSKPSSSQVIPTKLKDLRALMDNNSKINNQAATNVLEHYSDYFKMDKEDLDKLTYATKEFYIFGQEYDTEQFFLNGWTYSFTPAYYANTVLDLLPKVTNDDPVEWGRIKGSALFVRANTFFHLLKSFSPMYIKGNEAANNKPGIPLRLIADVNAISKRATVKEAYEQIVADLKEAIQLLPPKEQYNTRPDKASAYGSLARVYLVMQEFELAGKYADSSLRIDHSLFNFNELDLNAQLPFKNYNKETLYYSTSTSTALFNQTNNGYIHEDLVASYDENDLRKAAFFLIDNKGHSQFKGSYSGSSSGNFMIGVCVDEMYLTLAESQARSGRKNDALTALNTLLQTRWRTGTFVPFTAANVQEALEIVLAERKKSLIYRGVRVMDQRRLNLEPQFAKPVVRVLDPGGESLTYTLAPNDLRYVFLLPHDVVQVTGMPQPER